MGQRWHYPLVRRALACFVGCVIAVILGSMYIHLICSEVYRSGGPMVVRGLVSPILAPAYAVGTVTWWW